MIAEARLAVPRPWNLVVGGYLWASVGHLRCPEVRGLETNMNVFRI